MFAEFDDEGADGGGPVEVVIAEGVDEGEGFEWGEMLDECLVGSAEVEGIDGGGRESCVMWSMVTRTAGRPVKMMRPSSDAKLRAAMRSARDEVGSYS